MKLFPLICTVESTVPDDGSRLAEAAETFPGNVITDMMGNKIIPSKISALLIVYILLQHQAACYYVR